MSPLVTSQIVFGAISAAGMFGLIIGGMLPESHRHAESKDSIKQGLTLIASLAALVLALLVASSNDEYRSNTSAIRQLAADAMMLDRVLSLYGPDVEEERGLLRKGVAATIERIFPAERGAHADLTPGEARPAMELFYDEIADLDPKDKAQEALKSRALDLVASLLVSRLKLYVQKENELPTPFLIVLVFWLMILVGGCGLLAPQNTLTVAILLICALSLSCAIFLILELGQPFDGIIHISSQPLRDALGQIGAA